MTHTIYPATHDGGDIRVTYETDGCGRIVILTPLPEHVDRQAIIEQCEEHAGARMALYADPRNYVEWDDDIY